jgi:AcrR family transcriptional regulator
LASQGSIGDAGEKRPVELGPLPGGFHGLTREQIHDSQRERLLAAIVREVAANGYAASKITELVKLASVSTRDFYTVYDSKEACFLAAFDVVRDHLQDLISTAAASQTEWPHQVIAGLRACLEFFAAQPDLARFFLLEAIAATPATANRFRETLLACDPALAAGRAELTDPDSLLPGTESSIVGGAVSLVSHRIVAGETERLPELLPDLIEFTLSPYLGAERSVELAATSAAR